MRAPLFAPAALLLSACGASEPAPTAEPAPASTQAPSEAEPGEPAQAELPPEEVMGRIRERYLRGIQRCHERALKRDPGAGGEITLRFTVGPTGRVTRAAADSFDPSVSACVEGLAERWRFGIPKTPDGLPGEAEFELPLVLQPGG